MRLTGKVALVTGGGSGIGRGICIRFAEEGAQVAVADVSRESAEETAEEVRRLETQALAIEADVTSQADCERMVQETIASLGKLDIFVANAGIGRGGPVLELAEEDWEAVIRTNLTGVFLSCQAAARQMVKQGRGGRIITMASVLAERAMRGVAAYAAAKAGVRMLTRVAALELAPHRITVNAIGPGLIDTPMVAPLVEAISAAEGDVAPLGRVGEPKDVADVALFLASDEADYVTGGIIVVDGGLSDGGLFAGQLQR